MYKRQIQEVIPEPQPKAKAKGRPKKSTPYTVEAKRDRSRAKDPHDAVLEDEKQLAQTQAEILKDIHEKDKPKKKRASKRESEAPPQEEQKAKAKKISPVEEKEEPKPKAKPKQMLNHCPLKKAAETRTIEEPIIEEKT